MATKLPVSEMLNEHRGWIDDGVEDKLPEFEFLDER